MDYKEKVIALLNNQELSKEQKEKLEKIFPELAESEDEKIRKMLLKAFKLFAEKQAWVCHCLDDIDWDKCIAWFEKQTEQNPTDKVEPKFKVEKDRWYVCTSQYCNCIEGRNYKASLDGRIIDDYGTEYDMHSDAYRWFRPWTIQDAENGDVLYCESGGIEYIVMSKGINEHGNMDSYFRYNSLDGFDVDIPSVLSARHDNITPATKEQRYLLFQKMNEAGYEWDAEKKELKKIEQNPWSKEDESNLNGILNCYKSMDIKWRNWLKSLKDRFTWKPSEEQLNALHWCVMNVGSTEHQVLQELLEQLEKLKD